MQIITTEIPEENLPDPSLDDANTAFVEWTTDGYFWRTSRVLSCTVVAPEDGVLLRRQWIADPDVESDEYSILDGFAHCPLPVTRFVTFHGTSFLLPYMKKKLRAYDLPDPLAELSHIDLYTQFKPLSRFLSLPSRRLADHLSFLGAEDIPEGERITRITQLIPYLGFLGYGDPSDDFGIDRSDDASVRGEENAFPLPDCRREGDLLVFTFPLKNAVPKPLHFRSGIYHVLLSGESGTITAAFDQSGRLRRYFLNPADYVYLPFEGYAIPRHLTASLPKDRTEPCTLDTCYSLFTPGESFCEKPEQVQAYVNSVLVYLRGICR